MAIYCDSTGALMVAGDATDSSRTKLVALRFFVTELVKEQRVTLKFVPSGKMLADGATKHRPRFN